MCLVSMLLGNFILAAVKTVYFTVSDVKSSPCRKGNFSFYCTDDLSCDYTDDYP